MAAASTASNAATASTTLPDEDGETFHGVGDFEVLVAHDLKAALHEWLTPVEHRILACLEEGLSARETARLLHTSHTLVIKHRHHMASLLARLEPDLRTRAHQRQGMIRGRQDARRWPATTVNGSKKRVSNSAADLLPITRAVMHP